MQAVTATPRVRAASSATLAAAGLIALFGIIHLLLAWSLPLAPDETYYWEWSRRPGLGYYDQGPMVAWWIRASCLLFGDTQIGIRFGIVGAALLTQILVYLLARDLYGPRIALGALVLSSITPIAVAGGFIATYDPLLVLFWSAAMYLAARAVLFDSRLAWLGLAGAFGLGLLSKHTMALFAPCLQLFLLWSPDRRVWLRRPEPYLALLVGLAIFAPNLWWQSQHGWMTFRHLFAIAGGDNHTVIRRVGDYVGSQAGLITPLLFLGFLCALWIPARARDTDDRSRFLVSMSAPVLLFFLLMAVKAKVQANWAICGWLAPPIAYAAWLNGRPAEAGPGANRGRAPVALYNFVAIAICVTASLVLLAPGFRSALRLRIPARWDQTNRLFGGAELAAAVDRERRSMQSATAAPVVPAAATYDTASWMAFYMAGQPRVFCFFAGTRLNSYILWNKEAGLKPGANAIIADGRPADDPLLPPYYRLFDRVVPVAAPVEVRRPGVHQGPIKAFYLYRCYSYRPNPAVEQPKGG